MIFQVPCTIFQYFDQCDFVATRIFFACGLQYITAGSENEILWLFSEQITDQGKKLKNFFTGYLAMIIDDVLLWTEDSHFRTYRYVLRR